MTTTMSKLSKSNNSKLKNENTHKSKDSNYSEETNEKHKYEANWLLILPIAFAHVCAFQGLILLLSRKIQTATIVWMLVLAQLSTIGVSVGAHRYFCHKSFKAKPLLEAILILLQSISGQFSVYDWVSDHRLHHQYSDTEGDPHNSQRGFFYCYLGWLLTKRNEYSTKLQEKVHMDDLLNNKMVMFQHRFFLPLHILIGIVIPTAVPVYFFNETWYDSLMVAGGIRYFIQLHYTFALVAFGHYFGTRPYDKNIQPVDSWFLTCLSWGDGNHNFHHVYPWDYKNAEDDNMMARIIRLCEKLGLVSNLKEASKEMVKERVLRTGDGTHPLVGKEKRNTFIL